MALAEVTRDGILKAIEEFDHLGRAGEEVSGWLPGGVISSMLAARYIQLRRRFP